MENTLSRISVACNLARRLEANLQSMANQPQSLLRSCEEVAAAFDDAICSLLPPQSPPLVSTHMLFGDTSGGPQAMDLLGRRGDVGEEEDDNYPLSTYAHGTMENPEMEPTTTAFGIGSSCFAAPAADLTPPVGAALEGSSSGYGRRTTGSTSGQRSSRKRKESSKTHTLRVPALSTGNMDIPPDDGFTWRKYGQKDILGSKFPRSYYRCTHKNFYGCEAKKQVQRLDEEPYTYEVTYCGEHTCLTSPTPLMLHRPSGPYDVQQGEVSVSNQLDQSTQLLSPSLPASSIQLSIGLFSQQYDGCSEGKGTNAGPSDCPVADLADAMFNSASSGSSIDAIFSLKQENYNDKE